MSNIKNNIIKFQLYFCSLKFIPSFITVYILSFFELIYNFYNNILKNSKNEEVERFLILRFFFFFFFFLKLIISKIYYYIIYIIVLFKKLIFYNLYDLYKKFNKKCKK